MENVMEITDIAGFDRVFAIIEAAVANKTLSKLIMSRSRDKTILRTVVTLFEGSGELYVCVESFLSDGKAVRKNHPASGAELQKTAKMLAETALVGYKQVNIICAELTSEILISDKGKLHIVEKKQKLREITALNEVKSAILRHDNVKKYLLTEGEAHDFLIKLGVSNSDGRIFDKKQAKFRQINKFLEQIETIYGELPREGELCVCDLCCGKSYLTFAAYWYFAIHKQRKISLYGVDLKADVIKYCSGVASSLGWSGMHFSVGDVSRFTPPVSPDLVISLHACDVATDYVLAGAVRSGAKVILSTPCCHHELNKQIACKELELICKHSMLKQKLADAATDALRAKMLEICGYKVTVCELIDPEETPKNLLIRAVKRGRNVSDVEKKALINEYRSACAFLGVEPTLARLLEDRIN